MAFIFRTAPQIVTRIDAASSLAIDVGASLNDGEAILVTFN